MGILLIGTVTAGAGTIELAGVIRDFTVNHPDMQRKGPKFKVIQNMVLDQIGQDGKPVLNNGKLNKNFRIESADSFDQWFNDTPGVNISIPYSITLDNGQEGSGGIYSFAIEKPEYFFPVDGLGWNDTAADKNRNQRNFYFTYEIHTQFTYTNPTERTDDLVFSFTGDDDVWVFINGKLAVDIGGVHPQVNEQINLDDNAEALGLVPGESYPLDFFFAERYTSQSNFRIETTIELESTHLATISPGYD